MGRDEIQALVGKPTRAATASAYILGGYSVRILVVSLFALIFSGCGTTPPDSPPVTAPLFELEGQDLLIEVPGNGESSSQQQSRTVRVKHLPATSGDSLYLETDASLIVGDDGITIQDLQAIAHEAPDDPRYHDLLVRIFNEYGVSMSYLPRGFSAGLGASIDLSENVDASNVLEHLTGQLWYGKYFERPDECSRIARGANRIAGSARIDFVARLIPQHLVDRYVANPKELDIDARSNYVDLDYKNTQPGKRRTGLEEPNTYSDDSLPVLRLLAGLVERLGVYDLAVVIPGKNGPILVGRTWLGDYADNQEQTYSASALEGKQMAWFFLDFNEAAITMQKTPRLSRVDYTPKSTCARRLTSTDLTALPDPRPL